MVDSRTGERIAGSIDRDRRAARRNFVGLSADFVVKSPLTR